MPVVFFSALGFLFCQYLAAANSASILQQQGPVNIWSDLNPSEAEDVYGFLAHDCADLNITRAPKTNIDNFVVSIETLQPSKSQTLPYLFGEGEPTGTVGKGCSVPPHTGWPFLDLLCHGTAAFVTGDERRASDLPGYPFNSGQSSVPNLMADFGVTAEFARSLAANVSDITTELLGAKVNRQDSFDPTICNRVRGFTRLEPGLVIGWIQYFRPGMGSSGRTASSRPVRQG